MLLSFTVLVTTIYSLRQDTTEITALLTFDGRTVSAVQFAYMCTYIFNNNTTVVNGLSRIVIVDSDRLC